MASIDESGLVGQIRDRPVNSKLRRVLLAAARDADVDVVRVVSGGQPGSRGQRTGSHRHDDGNAADIDLIKDERTLNFTNDRDLETFRQFVISAAAHGAIGIGAGVKYMGPTRIHVGFGSGPEDRRRVVWGAGNTSANAPAWLREAAARGWADPVDFDAEIPDESWAQYWTGDDTMTEDPQVERFRPLLDFIAHHEGTANQRDNGYNTSLGYGRYLPGRAEIDLVGKTLDQIYQIGLGMRRQPGNPNSSALGRYQIVGQTMRELQKKRGLPGTTKFSPEIQDLFATDLIRECGRNAQRLAGKWASLESLRSAAILAAYDEEGVMTLKPNGKSTADVLPQDMIATFLAWLRKSGAGSVPGFTDSDWPLLQQGVNSDAAVMRLQSLLNDLRYYTGGTDGKFGPITRGAVALFQLDNGLPVTGAADAETWAALTNGSARPMSEQRAALTADDMRQLGSKTIRNADWVRYSGWLAGLLGAGGLTKGGACTMDPTLSLCNLGSSSGNVPTVTAALQNVDFWQKLLGASTDANVTPVKESLDVLHKFLDAVPAAASSPLGSIATSALGLLPGGWAGSLLALGLGFAVNRFGNNIINRRVADQRDGKHIGSGTT